MKVKGRKAGIYSRISSDRDGESTGVQRQIEDCRALASDRGYTVVDLFTDNHQSAMTGRRPEFARLLAAVKSGDIDLVLCWATDRLYRRVNDLEHLVDALGSVPVATVKSGDVDLSNADGKMVARVMGSISQHSSEKSGERVARASLQRAEQGLPNGGPRRLGYTADSSALVTAEADALTWAYRHVLIGGTLGAVVRKWADLGVVGTQGGVFRSSQVRKALLRPQNGGLRVHKGSEMGKALSPAIVPEETFRKVRAILTDPARTTPRGRPVQSLLGGILQCGRCEKFGRMVSDSRRTRNGARIETYKCHNCTRSRTKAILDEQIAKLVLYWVAENRVLLQRPAVTEAADPAKAEVDRINARLEELSDLYTADEIDPNDYAQTTKKLRLRLTQAQARVTVTTSTPLAFALTKAVDIEATWQVLSTEAKRGVIRESLVRITVGEGSRSPKEPMTGIEPVWVELTQ